MTFFLYFDGKIAELVHISQLASFEGSLTALAADMQSSQQQAKNTEGAEGAPLRDAPDLDIAGPLYFMDWYTQLLPGSFDIHSISKPGVLFIMYGPGLQHGPPSFPNLNKIKYNAAVLPITRGFLSSIEAQFEPFKQVTFDVFLSYASEDLELATELHQMLEAAGVRSFLASKSIGLGQRWEKAIREALVESAMVVLLVTKNSLSKPWVLTESGAAWALDIPLAVALVQVSADELQAVLPSFQARPFDTSSQRKAFVSEVAELIGIEPEQS